MASNRASKKLDRNGLCTYPQRVVANHAQRQLPAVLHLMFGEVWLLFGLIVAVRLGEDAQLAFIVAAVCVCHAIGPDARYDGTLRRQE